MRYILGLASYRFNLTICLRIVLRIPVILIKLKNMKKTLLALSMYLVTTVSNAGLLGSQVNLAHQFEDRIDMSGHVIVTDDNSDIFNMYLGNNIYGPVGYTIRLYADLCGT